MKTLVIALLLAATLMSLFIWQGHRSAERLAWASSDTGECPAFTSRLKGHGIHSLSFHLMILTYRTVRWLGSRSCSDF